MREVELKLTAMPQDLPTLKQALLAMSGMAETSCSMLNSTYFDTPDQALLRQKMVLRIRRDGPDFIQTVKGCDTSGSLLLKRGEWEDPVASNTIDTSAPNTGRYLTPFAGKLLPLFTTEINRTTIVLEPDSATLVEAAVDQGEIRAVGGKAFEPVCEIELELKRGEPAILYGMALQLLDAVPLRHSTVTKAERGYRLAKGRTVTLEARYADPAILTPDMTVETALMAIGRASLVHIIGNEAAVLAQIPEGVHQMRVALRRLRSVLMTFRSLLPAEQYRWVGSELKWIADTLSIARGWDVTVLSLLQPVIEAFPRDEELKSLFAVCAQRQQQEFDKVREALLSPRYVSTLLRIARWFETRAWRDQRISEASTRLLGPVTDIAPGLIDEIMRKFLKKSRQFARLDVPERHEVRIASKKLRYMIESLGSLYKPQKVNAFLKLLRPVQETLGQASDIATAYELLDTLKVPRPRRASSGGHARGLVLGWHMRGLADREKETRKQIARLRKAEPFW